MQKNTCLVLLLMSSSLVDAALPTWITQPSAKTQAIVVASTAVVVAGTLAIVTGVCLHKITQLQRNHDALVLPKIIQLQTNHDALVAYLTNKKNNKSSDEDVKRAREAQQAQIDDRIKAALTQTGPDSLKSRLDSLEELIKNIRKTIPLPVDTSKLVTLESLKTQLAALEKELTEKNALHIDKSCKASLATIEGNLRTAITQDISRRLDNLDAQQLQTTQNQLTFATALKTRDEKIVALETQLAALIAAGDDVNKQVIAEVKKQLISEKIANLETRLSVLIAASDEANQKAITDLQKQLKAELESHRREAKETRERFEGLGAMINQRLKSDIPAAAPAGTPGNPAPAPAAAVAAHAGDAAVEPVK